MKRVQRLASLNKKMQKTKMSSIQKFNNNKAKINYLNKKRQRICLKFLISI